MEMWWWWLVWLLAFAALVWVLFRSGRGMYRGARSARSGRTDVSDSSKQRTPHAMRRGGGEDQQSQVHRDSTEQQVAQTVEHRIKADGSVDWTDAAVVAHGARVILHGRVATQQQQRAAAAIASSVPGVRSVDNRLHVDPAARNDHRH